MCVAHAQRPIQNPLLQPVALAFHALANLLEHARHGDKDGGPYRLHRVLQQVKLRAIRQRRLIAHQSVIEVPRRHMRQRQKRDASVLLGKPERLGRERDIARQIAMRQHHALRLAGRAGGVDDRRQVVRLHRPHHRIERRILRLQALRPSHQRGKTLSAGSVKEVHRHHMFQRRQLSC